MYLAHARTSTLPSPQGTLDGEEREEEEEEVVVVVVVQELVRFRTASQGLVLVVGARDRA
jgi:hypothetical protein